MATRQQKVKLIATSVDQIPGKQLACRAQHPWPSIYLLDSRGVPKGLIARLVDPDAGMWWVLDICPRCGKIRYLRYPNRVYDGTGWHYVDPRDGSWVVYQERLSRGEAFRENVQRNFSKLFVIADESEPDGDTS